MATRAVAKGRPTTEGRDLSDPSETLDLLNEAHLPNLSEDHLRLLAARVTGYKPQVIADRLYRDAREVRRRSEHLEELICVPAGLARDSAVLGFWFGLHLDCKYRCSAPATAMTESGAVFPPEISPENSPENA